MRMGVQETSLTKRVTFEMISPMVKSYFFSHSMSLSINATT